MSKKFDWVRFSDLLQVIMSFGVVECSSCHSIDEIVISVTNQPLNDEEKEDVRGTVHEKLIRLDWTADFMDYNYSCSKQRSHEDLLRRWFKGYNMKASFFEPKPTPAEEEPKPIEQEPKEPEPVTPIFFRPHWTLFLWVPQEKTVWKHTFEYDNCTCKEK